MKHEYAQMPHSDLFCYFSGLKNAHKGIDVALPPYLAHHHDCQNTVNGLSTDNLKYTLRQHCLENVPFLEMGGMFP